MDDAAGFTLTTGVRVAITFINYNYATTPTLNVNGTGAKEIVFIDDTNALHTGSGSSFNTWRKYQTIIFYYNGLYWIRCDSFSPYAYQSKQTNSLVGSYLTRTFSSDPSFSSGAWRRVTYLTITPGTWIITASMHFNQITGGASNLYASINQGVNSDASSDAGFSYESSIALTYVYLPAGDTPNLCLSGIADVTGSNDVNIYLHTFCTRNYSINHSSFTFKALKII